MNVECRTGYLEEFASGMFGSKFKIECSIFNVQESSQMLNDVFQYKSATQDG